MFYLKENYVWKIKNKNICFLKKTVMWKNQPKNKEKWGKKVFRIMIIREFFISSYVTSLTMSIYRFIGYLEDNFFFNYKLKEEKNNPWGCKTFFFG